MAMAEDRRPDLSPDIGPSTDVDLGDETVTLLIRGRGEEARRRHEATGRTSEKGRSAPLVETPDDLGGTGGGQAGGAG